MRFLKNKIALATKAKLHNNNSSKFKQPEQLDSERSASSNSEFSQNSNLDFPSTRRRLPGHSFTSETVKITKNIVLNYGRAISGFAMSKLSEPYWQTFVGDEQVDRTKFNNYVQKVRNTIGGICSFKEILIVSKNDSQEERLYKKIYQKLAEVFIKYFSVNWIIHGRMGHKEVYLKYRYKMLRRVLNPELFTYLKDPKEKLLQGL